MPFRRASLRYGTTEAPVTPYQKAAQVWDERLGTARVQAKNWRFMAFSSLFLAIGLAGGLVWVGTTSRIAPYVVEIDKEGSIRVAGAAIEDYRPVDAQIAFNPDTLELTITSSKPLPRMNAVNQIQNDMLGNAAGSRRVAGPLANPNTKSSWQMDPRLSV